MTKKQQALFVFLIWLCVYPGVFLIAELIAWAIPGSPVWLRILLSTAVTVPSISLFVIPQVNKPVAMAKGQSPAELKRAQADAIEKGGK